VNDESDPIEVAFRNADAWWDALREVTQRFEDQQQSLWVPS
jgi:hypothetical protein